MKKTLLALALIVAVSVPAYAQMMDPSKTDCKECNLQKMEMGHMDKMGDMMDMCLEHADKIGLTEEQIVKIKPIHREMKKKGIRFKADLELAEIELKEIMEVKDFDLEKANAAVKKIADLKTAHHLDKLKSMKEVRSILTDEQFKKMKAMMPMKMGKGKPAKGMKHKQ